MKKENFEEAKELETLINYTKKAIEGLSKIQPNDGYGKDRVHCDGLLNLYITETSYCNDNKAELSRFYGNKRLLDVILAELKLQLSEFEDRFEKL